MFRWKDPETGKVRQCNARNPSEAQRQAEILTRRMGDVAEYEGEPITSLTTARLLARRLSERIQQQQTIMELRRAGVRVDSDGVAGLNAENRVTWKGLCEKHTAELEANAASPDTHRAYKSSWNYFENWQGKPDWPDKLDVLALRDFVRHLRQYRRANGKPLCDHSIASIGVHVKARLNFGRKFLRCVKLDGETVNMGLKSGRTPHLVPVVLTTDKLREILAAARDYDESTNADILFPFLCFVMVTGCRRGEAQGLRFDPSVTGAAESWLDLPRDLAVIWGRKTGVQRFVPLGKRPLLARVLKVMERGRDKQGEPYVFGRMASLGLGNARVVKLDNGLGVNSKRALKAVKSAAGGGWKIKSLRSTNASMLANSALGLNLHTLAGELGHSVAILERHYARHMTLSPMIAASTTVETLLGIDKEIEAWLAAREPKAIECKPA
jgi:integrase